MEKSGFFERVGGVLLEPKKTFNRILEENIGFGEPILLLIAFFGVETALIGVILARVSSTILGSLSRLFGGFTQPSSLTFLYWLIPLGTTITTIIVVLISWLILVGLTHFSAKYFFKGLGKFSQLLKLYGYSSILLFLPIFGTVILIVNPKLLIYSLILNFISIFWLIVIWVAAVESCHKIDAGKAFFSVFVWPLAIWLIITFGLWFSTPMVIRGIFS